MSNTLVSVPEEILAVYRAADSKKALDVKVLDLRNIASFTDYFVICSGTNLKQNQAISDEIGEELAKLDLKPVSTEGYQSAGWILMDYGDFVIHVFHEETRRYYDLERLWNMAEAVALPADAVTAA